jgi:hypothetical protein
MKIKINFNLSDIIEALDVVSAVNPNATEDGTAGYLFSVKGKECHLYSSGLDCVARAKFDLIESSEDGAFVFPAHNLSDSLRPLAKEEDTCIIEAISEEGSHVVKYVTSPDGAKAEFGTISPDSVSRYDEDLEAATETYYFSAGVLREAISLARPFMADKAETDSGAYRGIEVMDKGRFEKGDGYLYASDKYMACFFKSEHFSGKRLAISDRFISAFLNFLSKCDDTVAIKIGGDKTFALNEKGDIFGWSKLGELHDKFNYHSLKMDSLVVKVSRSRLLNALDCAKGALKKEDDTIIFNYDAKIAKIWFDVPSAKAKSIKVEAAPVTEEEEGTKQSKADSFSVPVSVRQFTELFQTMRGYDVTFRGYLGKPKEDGSLNTCLFRTIDDVKLNPKSGKPDPSAEDGIQCRVTRFTPSQRKK